MDEHEPFKPAVLHILLALAERDLHGYALMQAVAHQSNGRITLRTGSLYRHLARLIDEGLVDEAAPPSEVEDIRRGVHYRLTTLGARALEHERTYLTRVMTAFRAVDRRLRKDLA